MANINLSPNADASKVSDYSRQVLSEIADRSGNSSLLITSTARTPHQQAVAMHDNCLHHGVEANYRLYSRADGTRLPGCDVIDVFVADGSKSAAQTIADMEAMILQLGPERVSHHCADTARLNVVDVAISALAWPTAFLREATGDHRVSKALDESSFNHCLHLEIAQP